MKIGILGINHKSAELHIREALALACQRRFNLHASTDFSFVLLSTCNRQEVYFHSEDLAATHSYLLGILRSETTLEFEHSIYSYFGNECFSHLAKVTSGFDSAIIFETEIQGQVKLAYEEACLQRPLSSELHFLFQKCLKIGKDIRTVQDHSSLMPTLEEIIFKTACHFLTDFTTRKILFMGLSEINQKIFSKFKQKNAQNITFCNRSCFSENDLPRGTHFLPWNERHLWHAYDLIIFGTKCPTFLLHAEDIHGLTSKKLILDLSVPRNVDPKLKKHPLITLLNVDQLNRAVDRRRRLKAIEMARLEMHNISHAVTRQIGIFKRKESYSSLELLNQNSA